MAKLVKLHFVKNQNGGWKRGCFVSSCAGKRKAQKGAKLVRP
jgi:hypothetical protein